MRLVQVIGLETEIRFVLRDVLERGLPLDDVEIAYTAAHRIKGCCSMLSSAGICPPTSPPECRRR